VEGDFVVGAFVVGRSVVGRVGVFVTGALEGTLVVGC